MSTANFPRPSSSLAHAPLVLILGLGVTGIAVARWMTQQGARLRIADKQAQPAGLAALQVALEAHTLPAQPDYHLGCAAFDSALLDDVAQVVMSPGLSPHHAALQPLLTAACARGIEVVGEIELFARALATLAETRQYRPQLLAITGTNGKTTVTALTQGLVAASGRSVCAVGNVGSAALLALMTALENETLPDVWVLELSSFQLATTTSLVPDAAVVLNITQDHLDWHCTMQDYIQAKARLLQMTRLAIVNRDDGRLSMVQDMKDKSVISFGSDPPVQAGDFGLIVAQGVTWLATDTPASLVPLLAQDKLTLRGHHNVMNILAALALGRAIGLAWDAMLAAVQIYTGEPHRVACIGCIDQVDFIDDSKGTNVGATVAALEGLGQTIVLIVGGVGKDQDFSLLQNAVARHARAVIYIGQDGPKIAAALTVTGVPGWFAQDLRAAVRQAMALAQPKDAILLSPACASFDMFRDYVHRAQVFAQEFLALALEKGAFA